MKVNRQIIANFPTPARLCIFILVLLLVWLPFAFPLSLILAADPNLATIMTMGLLGLEFLVLLKLWSQYVYRISHGWQHYGLEWSSRNAVSLLQGLSIGLLFCLSLFFTESLFGWLTIKTTSFTLVIVIAQGLLSALAVAFFEELFFRGWLLTELERDYKPNNALIISALVFGILHFIKPLEAILATLPQFPALVLLGSILVWARRLARGRLGLSMGLHAGLIWGYYILNVGNLLNYHNNVSTWITGVNQNPIAGLMGIIFLSVLAWQIKRRI